MTSLRTVGIRKNLWPATQMMACRPGVSGHRGYRKFVVIGSNRTGTNMVLHLLRTSPRVVGFAEVFSKHGPFWAGRTFSPLSTSRARQLRETDPERFLDRAIFRRYPPTITAVGFKAHYGQLEQYPSVLERLRETDDLTVVHIRRKNLLSMVTSVQRAHQTGKYLQDTDDPTEDRTMVHLDVDEILGAFERYDSNSDWPERMLPNANIEQLVYEDLSASPTNSMQSIVSRLDLADASLEPQTAKQNPLGWRGTVSNASAVEQALAKTKFSYLLDLPE